MVLNSLFPVVALIVIGKVLKLTRFVNDGFLKTSDRLVYYIFFPSMLFWKIGGASSVRSIDLSLPIAALLAIGFVFIASTLYIVYAGVTDFQAGSFSQSCYRFNTYIGMAIIFNALGDEGVLHFGVLIGVVIPVINVLSISILIWFSGRSFDVWERLVHLLKAIISNPLIIACFGGILFAGTTGVFPVFIDNTFRLVSMVTLPLALISIGSTVTFNNIQGQLRLSLVSSVFKLLLLPISGMMFLKLFSVSGVAFQVGMIFFSLPTSSAIYVLSSQMNSDTDLAASIIVFSTLASFVSISIVLALI